MAAASRIRNRALPDRLQEDSSQIPPLGLDKRRLGDGPGMDQPPPPFDGVLDAEADNLAAYRLVVADAIPKVM